MALTQVFSQTINTNHPPLFPFQFEDKYVFIKFDFNVQVDSRIVGHVFPVFQTLNGEVYSGISHPVLSDGSFIVFDVPITPYKIKFVPIRGFRNYTIIVSQELPNRNLTPVNLPLSDRQYLIDRGIDLKNFNSSDSLNIILAILKNVDSVVVPVVPPVVLPVLPIQYINLKDGYVLRKQGPLIWVDRPDGSPVEISGSAVDARALEYSFYFSEIVDGNELIFYAAVPDLQRFPSDLEAWNQPVAWRWLTNP